MPIKGISGVHTRLPRVGKIKTGIKKKSSGGKDYPVEVPYFVFNPFEEQEDRKGNPIIDQKTGKVMVKENKEIQRAIEVYGTDKPTELRVIFPMDPLESNDLCISSYMKWWGNGTMTCVGDGEFAHYRGNEQVTGLNDPIIPRDHEVGMGLVANRVCNRDLCPQALSGKCKAEANIRVILPDVCDTGVFQIDTRSIQAIMELETSLMVIRQSLNRKDYPSLAGVPLRLVRERRKNTKQGENYIIQVRFDQDTFAEEERKLAEGQRSYLEFGNPQGATRQITAQMDKINLLEPNFDLIPQSEHGRSQTGEIGHVVETEHQTGVTEDVAKTWLEDPAVKECFNRLATKLGTAVTVPKMLARARLYSSKEDLIQYLKEQVS